MIRVHTAIAEAKAYPNLINILKVATATTTVATEVIVAFLLHDEVEGSLFGLRTFIETTEFLDVHDFIYELWLSEGLVLLS